jgi:hypothetical protein
MADHDAPELEDPAMKKKAKAGWNLRRTAMRFWNADRDAKKKAGIKVPRKSFDSLTPAERKPWYDMAEASQRKTR